MSAKEALATIVEFLSVLLSIVAICFQEMWFIICPPARKSLNGKVVLLTGAGHGVGKLLAEKLAQLGAHVVLVDINKANNDATADELRRKGFDVWAFRCDVSSEDEVKRLREHVRSDVGEVFLVINNAAIVNCRDILNLTEPKVRRTFDVNVLAHIWIIREFLPDMIAKRSGHIAAMSSIAGLTGTAYLTDYCASKFAVRGLMHSLEEELYCQGLSEYIKLTTVCPVAINTGMFRQPTTRFSSVAPILEAEEVAKGVLDAILTDQGEVVLPHSMFAAYKIINLLPSRAQKKLQRFMGYGVNPHENISCRPSVPSIITTCDDENNVKKD